MRHMLGDYYSTIDPIPAFIIVAILIVLFILIVLVQNRRAEVKRRREQNAAPTRTRATYLAAQDSKKAEIDAIYSTHP